MPGRERRGAQRAGRRPSRARVRLSIFRTGIAIRRDGSRVVRNAASFPRDIEPRGGNSSRVICRSRWLDALYGPLADSAVFEQSVFAEPALFAIEFTEWRKCGGTGESSPARPGTRSGRVCRGLRGRRGQPRRRFALLLPELASKCESPHDGGMLAVRMEEKRIRELLSEFPGIYRSSPSTAPNRSSSRGSRRALSSPGSRVKGSDGSPLGSCPSRIYSHPPISKRLLAAFRQIRRRRPTLTAENPPLIEPDGASVRNGDHERGLFVPTARRASPLCRQRPDPGRSMRSIPGNWPAANAAAVGSADSERRFPLPIR